MQRKHRVIEKIKQKPTDDYFMFSEDASKNKQILRPQIEIESQNALRIDLLEKGVYEYDPFSNRPVRKTIPQNERRNEGQNQELGYEGHNRRKQTIVPIEMEEV